MEGAIALLHPHFLLESSRLDRRAAGFTFRDRPMFDVRESVQPQEAWAKSVSMFIATSSAVGIRK
jgi:hypothetical protein